MNSVESGCSGLLRLFSRSRRIVLRPCDLFLVIPCGLDVRSYLVGGAALLRVVVAR